MNEPTPSPETVSDGGPDETTSALFADLVLRQTQMALLLMGKMPAPNPANPIVTWIKPGWRLTSWRCSN